MQILNHVLVANFLFVFSLMCCSTAFASGASTTEVFIATAGPATHHSSMVTTAIDAAVAMNSIEFIEQLSSIKNTADIKTYTRASVPSHTIDHGSAKQQDVARFFGAGDAAASDSSDRHFASKFTEDPKPPSKNMSTSHETVSEYIGILWFLPESTGIRFRETIRILSISADGRTSTVECTTQYMIGSGRWIDCSNIICVFSSAPIASVGNDELRPENGDKAVNVKMTLDCEIFVWLPGSKHIKKKISSVFETAALDFFKNLASN